MRWPWPADRLTGWLLPVLALVAEGAWVAVVYVAVETTIDGRPPLLGTLELAAAAGIGAIAVRRAWIDPDLAPLRFFGAVLAIGAVGWLWSAEARTALVAGNLPAAIGAHPGGWLVLVAAMRGVGRGHEFDDRALTRLVLVGVPGLAIPWTLGQLAAGDLRPAFVEGAFVASLTFVAAGFMAAGLARLSEIGRETGVDWRRNRSWLGTVVGVLAVVLAIGVPGAAFLGLPVDTVARSLIGPAVSLIGYAFLALAFVAGILSTALYELLSRLGIALPRPMGEEELARLPEIREYTIEQLQGPLVTVGLLWLAIGLLAVIVIRTWLRRRIRRLAGGMAEERSIAIPQRSFRLPRRGARHGRPHLTTSADDAVAAYLAALATLDAHRPELARRVAETPHGHAARVALPEVGALQADYALARYGARRLTDTEHRRARGRLDRLRRRLGLRA